MRCCWWNLEIENTCRKEPFSQVCFLHQIGLTILFEKAQNFFRFRILRLKPHFFRWIYLNLGTFLSHGHGTPDAEHQLLQYYTAQTEHWILRKHVSHQQSTYTSFQTRTFWRCWNMQTFKKHDACIMNFPIQGSMIYVLAISQLKQQVSNKTKHIKWTNTWSLKLTAYEQVSKVIADARKSICPKNLAPSHFNKKRVEAPQLHGKRNLTSLKPQVVGVVGYVRPGDMIAHTWS